MAWPETKAARQAATSTAFQITQGKLNLGRQMRLHTFQESALFAFFFQDTQYKKVESERGSAGMNASFQEMMGFHKEQWGSPWVY